MSDQEQIERRLGRFEVHENLVDNFPLATEMFRQLGFVPWDVQYDGKRASFNMLGTSPQFRGIRGDEPAPWYQIVIRPVDGEENTGMMIVEAKEQPLAVPADAELTAESKVAGNG